MELLRHPFGRLTGTVAATAAACASIYICVGLVSSSRRRRGHAGLRKTTCVEQNSGKDMSVCPYPPDALPGGRDVQTPYGSIKVFEWGPEHGEKVLLMHGIGTPCVALGDMAKELVKGGYRVMLFDFFGRGYSEAPVDLPYDARLYTTQILLVLASSRLAWTGSETFHLLGYSLGGAIAAAFAAYYPNLLRSLTLVCGGGLIRNYHLSRKTRFLYCEGLLPEWLLERMVRRRLEPHRGASADVPEVEDDNLDWDDVPISRDPSGGRRVRIGDVMGWQIRENEGLVYAYMSTIRNAPIYGQHDGVWKLLAARLRERRGSKGDAPPGLKSGRVCLILAERDPVIVKEECIEDTTAVLGHDAVDVHVLEGGHEIAISKGREVARIASSAWQ